MKYKYINEIQKIYGENNIGCSFPMSRSGLNILAYKKRINTWSDDRLWREISYHQTVFSTIYTYKRSIPINEHVSKHFYIQYSSLYIMVTSRISERQARLGFGYFSTRCLNI